MSSIAAAFVEPSTTANADLKRRVVTYLASRNFRSFRRLTVRANQGVLVLIGRLDSYYERQVAIESARRVVGVTTIIDRIVVDAVTSHVPKTPKVAELLLELSGSRI